MEGAQGHGGALTPSPWVRRWATRVAAGTVLDLACGGGRHARLFVERGLRVVAVDREPQEIPGARFLRADLEDGSPWPLPGERFQAVIVTNYLHRPLFPRLIEALAPGGLLIYETFLLGNERHGKPSNPEFLLRPGELLEAFRGLAILGFEEGFVATPKPSLIQRLCAVQAAKG
ncbi:MAG: class I SAM-dependent methyltransferase [Betaproteobacteria bacterium]|nr:class I SAM-dependent methyltransferase [Betaproteobacteria bacterium]